jgi:hypothetical protein
MNSSIFSDQKVYGQDDNQPNTQRPPGDWQSPEPDPTDTRPGSEQSEGDSGTGNPEVEKSSPEAPSPSENEAGEDNEWATSAQFEESRGLSVELPQLL